MTEDEIRLKAAADATVRGGRVSIVNEVQVRLNITYTTKII